MSHSSFVAFFGGQQEAVHANAKEKGFWPPEGRNDGELIALIHSECSEALEAVRNNITQSEHIPLHSGLAEELADIVIRCMDMAEGRGIDLGLAIEDKIEFNQGRKHKHGKNF